MVRVPFLPRWLNAPSRRHTGAGLRRNRRPQVEEIPLYQSPGRLLILLAVSIFFGETCVMLLLHLFPEPHPITEALLDSFMLLVVVLPTLFFFLFRPFMHHLRRQQQSEAEIRALSRRLLAASEEERKRVAMDLHDHFGQVLIGLHLNLNRLDAALTQRGVVESGQCREMAGMVEELCDEIRSYAAGLRPAIIDHLGLIPALDWLVAEQRRQHPKTQVTYRTLGIKSQPANQIAEAVYRITQEAFNNINKHADAHRVEVTLIHSHPRLILTVRDDGIGFVVPTDSEGGIGLWSMRERAALVGGRLLVSSKPGKGTTVRAELPMPAEL